MARGFLFWYAAATLLALSFQLPVVDAQRRWSNMSVFEFPFLQTHDAGTGYLVDDNNVVLHWTKTQPGDFKTQLECGARSFDLRPTLVSGTLYMHHGPIAVFKPLAEALNGTGRHKRGRDGTGTLCL